MNSTAIHQSRRGARRLRVVDVVVTERSSELGDVPARVVRTGRTTPGTRRDVSENNANDTARS